MSSKFPMKSQKQLRKKVNLSTQQPRELKEINMEYHQLCASAGQCQYQILQFSKQLDEFNAKLEEVNREATARQKLDKEEADKKQAETPKEA